MKEPPISPGLPSRPATIIAAYGACLGKPGYGGWAVVVDRRGERVCRSGGEPATTKSRMGARALIEAFAFTVPGERVCIVSDCDITVRGLTDWRHGWKARGWMKGNGKPVANSDLWRQLDSLMAETLSPLSFHWVHSDAVFALSEDAGRLANAAAEAVRCPY